MGLMAQNTPEYRHARYSLVPQPVSATDHLIPRKRALSISDTATGEPEQEVSAETIQTHSSGSSTNLNNEQDYTHLPPAKTHFARERSFFRWWLLEILSSVAAIACLAAMVAMLMVFDGQPHDSWPSTKLTLNGLIALLSTLCRTCLLVSISAALSQGKWSQFSARLQTPKFKLGDFSLFEKAAKGPLGSVQLLWRFKGLHIACVGAVLTILSLAFGVFSQQLIDLQLSTIQRNSSGATGIVPRATLVDSAMGYSTSWTPLSATKLSIYDGFMAPQIETPQVTCPTGNCTWPVVPTVGVCGACVDTTPNIAFNRTYLSSCKVSAGTIELTGQCEYSDFGTIFAIGPGSGEVFSSGNVSLNADAPNVIAEFAALGVPRSKSPSSTLNESLAAECALWYCLQARQVDTHEGLFTDRIIDTWNKASSSYNNTMGNLTFFDIPASFNVDRNDVYGLAQTQMQTMRTYFNETVRGNVSADGAVGIVWPSNDYAEGLHNGFDDIENWIDRLTQSMTIEVRRQRNFTPAENLRYRGTALIYQNTIIVRWVWIAYPAALVLVSVLYLSVEIVRTTQMPDVRAWKDDPLISLFLNLDEQLKHEVSEHLGEIDGAYKAVGKHTVTVTRGHNGFPTGIAVEKK